MNTASNVVQFDTTTTTTSSDIDWVGTDATSTVTIQNVCGHCGQWYQGYHQCPPYNWHQNWYPVQWQKDGEVAELKAWLDGFMTSRKMTERNLRKIQEKLEEFCE